MCDCRLCSPAVFDMNWPGGLPDNMNVGFVSSQVGFVDGKSARIWQVMRQDDNGNVFVVAENLTEEEARVLALEYERKGHKQTYWVEMADAAEAAEK